MSRKDISNLDIYQMGMDVGKETYELVNSWDSFNKNTIGYQIVRSVDSIPANISEGYGRFHFKEQRQFCYIARGSLYETRTWLEKAMQRMPDKKDSILKIQSMLDNIHIKLNAYIKYIERHINQNTPRN